MPLPKQLGRKDASNVLSAWIALEVLSPPQMYRNPVDLANGDGRRIADLAKLPELPWERGEQALPYTRLFYQVVIGAIGMEDATARLLEIYGDRDIERVRAAGLAPIAILTVDAKGIPVEPSAIVISSFAWGLPYALRRELSALGNWPTIEPKLIEEADRLVRRAGDDGRLLPVDHSTIDDLFQHLVSKLALPADCVAPPEFAVRIYQWWKAEEPPDPPSMGSFFLGDLAKAKGLVKTGAAPDLLKRYLGLTVPSRHSDLRCDNIALAEAVAPYRTPVGCWPSPSRHPLVLLQQAAVNLAIRDDAVTHLLPVNGPPGTGKTTLLRDLVVALIVQRARVMSAFADPNEAFVASGKKARSGTTVTPHYQIDARLTGFEIVVASSNNKAVENVSAELPALKAIDCGKTDLRYFKSIADNVARGLVNSADGDDDEQGRLFDRPPELTESCWGLIAAVLGNAKNRYAFRRTAWLDKDNGLRAYLLEASGSPQTFQVQDSKTGRLIESRKPRVVTAENPPASSQAALERWRSARKKFLDSVSSVEERLNILEQGRRALAPNDLSPADGIDRAAVISGARFVDAAFFDRGEDDLHRDIPWLDDETLRLREQVFVAAMELHRAFVDAAAKHIRSNLDLLFKTFFGRNAWAEKVRPLMPGLWATFFCVVPVVSTTFASIERMLGYLGPKELGWLLIDEAGQAAPQAAVGALIRARHAVVVGDPLQLPPITNLPTELTDKIAAQFAVDPDRFVAPAASVQRLADASSLYGTTISSDGKNVRVGVPLVVHRRCAEPMFSLSNNLAYGGMMVQGRGENSSSIRDVLGQSAWIDVKPDECEDKWSAAEGRVVVELFHRLDRAAIDELDIYLVSPFRIVAQKLRELLVAEKVLSRWTNAPRYWVRERVGTVYTVQGREADSVIMVLGAAQPGQRGARNWAGQEVNQLNVAVTRAKENLYVIGNRFEWATAGSFRHLERVLA